MTRRTHVHLGAIAVAAIVTLAAASCGGSETTADPTADPTATTPTVSADLTGVVFDEHRDPG